MSISNKQGSQSAARTLALLEAVTLDGGRTAALDLIVGAGLAPATGRRLLTLLVERGLLMRIAHGRYAGGDRLRELALCVSPHARLIKVARPILRRLARTERATAYLGIFEDEMVTYLIKEGAQTGFTREQMQLEAYCTGIGKILLSQLSEKALQVYLESPLVGLTEWTITNPSRLREEIALTRERGYAIDDREIADDLRCIAVALPQEGECRYAISLSGETGRIHPEWASKIAAKLHVAADQVVRKTGGHMSCLCAAENREDVQVGSALVT